MQPPDTSSAEAQQRSSNAVQEVFESSDVFGAATSSRQCASAAAVRQLAGSAHLLQSAAWQAYGCAALSHLHAVIHLVCYSEQTTPDDRACAYAQLLQLVLDKKGPAAAQQLLAGIEAKFSIELPRPLAAIKLMVMHDLVTSRGEWHAADAAVSELATLQQHDRPEIKLEVKHRHVLTLLARGSMQEAHSEAGDLFAACADSGLPLPAIRALLLQGRVHQKCCNPAAAMPYVLSALLHCQLMDFGVVAAEAGVQLAQLLLQLSPSPNRFVLQHAIRTVTDSLPTISSEAGSELQSRVKLLLAELILSSSEPSSGGDRAGGGGDCSGSASLGGLQVPAHDAADLLTAAVQGFSQLGLNRDAALACSLLAQVYHRRGDVQNRNAAAAQFHELSASAGSKLSRIEL